ncbi:MAG: RdgB/HAM1 family non-canonical purine NTP pyrophosphatase [Deltaproteobacteria bacterium]|nr:MAG: RdgB/HAM1 family non-canonical purine NTP pyrophosphatase [Deltaproteobacteria bacterium]
MTSRGAGTWVVATSNPAKLREIREILSELGVECVGLEGLPPITFPDEGDDYAENAARKARSAAEQFGRVAVADDSGLEVAGLDGGPGPLSARYGGPALDDSGRVAHLLAELGSSSGAARAARFVCVAALASPDGRVVTRRGECRGWIRKEPSGTSGFGYDPIFELESDGRTMAELDDAEKNRISHRARAFRALAALRLPSLPRSAP